MRRAELQKLQKLQKLFRKLMSLWKIGFIGWEFISRGLFEAATPGLKQRRLTDELVWIDYLEAIVIVEEVENWALGGARSANSNGVPTVAEQKQSHEVEADQEALYIIWAGINDMGNGGETPGEDAAVSMVRNIETLLSRGARRLVVPGMFRYPIFRGSSA